MAGTTQEAFFARIKASLVDTGERVDLPDDLEIARVVDADQDIVSVFAQRVDESGMHAHRVTDEQAIANKVLELIESGNGRSVIIPEEDLPGRPAIVSRLQDKGLELKNLNDADASFDADFGITGASIAIAETASLAVDSGGPRRRLASLAVPNHIAIVRTDQIVPDLLDAMTCDMPANRVLVSGPSKTADIEMILIMGVHGPKVVHVIIVG